MNYRHGYHAGNFADVFKHITLIALLTALSHKQTPYCYLDTHAGAGYYDLFSLFSEKTKEYATGIEKIIEQARAPDLVKRYIACIHKINEQFTKTTRASLRYYPGSPMIARSLLRPHDRIIACELHPEEYQALAATFAGDKQVAIHHMDGFLGLKAFLPPKERRGVVLIDPPYEDPDELLRIIQSLKIALKRWETGIYAIWYPIKEKKQLIPFYETIKQNITQPTLSVTLSIYPDLPQHLNGSGLIVINPPWQFDQTMEQILPWLWHALTTNQQGEYHLDTLVS
ncbi:MAG TPA: 23S rRNA (adenine(2030)-N(6))-methyltransferase RlmJ [Gammaproteobacteria bacterium]|jgi:23S rRNA (adenine2030-N6)-methyltransferase|nr:23S rRNA (adenine(2030)-N(6))-methyltransferase RlmJ [Gammaproteobacteria bacterium]